MAAFDSSLLTIDAVRMALDASTMRQRVLADNVANFNSIDHTRVRVSFEDRFANALAMAQSGESSVSISEVMGDARAELEVDPDQTRVDLDTEMMQMSTNVMHYQALTKGLARYLSIAELIASGTKG